MSPGLEKFRKTTSSNNANSKGSFKEFKYGTSYGSNTKAGNKIGTQPSG